MFNSAAGITPFKVVYGCNPPPLLKFVEKPSKIEEVNVMMKQRNEILERLKTNMHKAQQRMKMLADRNRREVELEVGDQAYLKLQPYRLRSLASRPNEKLSPRYYDHFEVEEKIGQVAYRLRLPKIARIHPVFHISQLKKRIDPYVTCTPFPRCLNEAVELEAQPEEVLDFCYSQ